VAGRFPEVIITEKSISAVRLLALSLRNNEKDFQQGRHYLPIYCIHLGYYVLLLHGSI
jgi:hypothetical protein